MAHMTFIGYASVSYRVQEIIEGGNDNEDSHVRAKVTTTLSKISPKKKKQVAHEDPHTRASSNVGVV
jgi:hypothetical protein